MKKAKYILSKQMPYLADNIVPIIFIAFTLLGFVLTTNVPFNFFLSELSSRFYRNAFIVLSLVIPVIAGLGLNFGIVIGAMSGQLAIIIVRYLSIEYLHLSGFWELVFCLVLSLPIAAFIGFLTGKLYNKTRGQEMIASLIVGFFANGVYQFILLFATGIIIPVRSSHPMIKPDGVGVRMTVDMGELHYSLQNILKVPFLWAVLLVSVLLLALVISRHLMGKKGHNKDNRVIFFTKVGLSAVLIIYSVFAIVTKSKITSVKDVPAATIIIIGLLCLFTELIMKTKLGQDFRSVGQSQHIAES
ncbi:MAG TPA: ABC transporter permease, partial [Bacillota bacterium]|nr:ABC transporter permease [Bacillota bacterium]